MNDDNTKKDKLNITIETENKPVLNNSKQVKAEVLPALKEASGESDTKLMRLPVLPLTDIVIFPYTLSTLVIDNEETIKFIMKVAEGERLLTLFPDLSKENLENQSSQSEEETEPSIESDDAEFSFDVVDIEKKSLSKIGVLGRIVKLLKFPDNTVRVLVRGLKRVRIVNILTETPNITASVEEVPDVKDDSIECVAMAKNAQNQFQEIISLSPNFQKN